MKKYLLGAVAALMMMASPVFAQQCAPEIEARAALSASTFDVVKELNADERKAFNDAVNAMPPASELPVPNTIILIQHGGRDFVVFTNFKDSSQLCISPVTPGSPFAALVARTLGVAS